MKNPLSSRAKLLVATVGLLAMAPFNMGGCADSARGLPGMSGFNLSSSGRNSGGQSDLIHAGIKSGVKAGNALILSESDERAMGEAVALEITTRYPIVSDQQLNRYVTLVGLTLASNTPRPDANWLFAVVETPEINAFSGPGGYILVTRGALKLMHDESELAGVLAHEMDHVLEHHGLEAVKRAGFGDAFATLANGTREAAPFQQVTGGVVDTVLVKGYGRDEENDADSAAVRLLAATGYDPLGYQHFIDRVGKKQSKQGGAFSTHPGASERVANIRKRLSEVDAVPHGMSLKDRFEKMTGQGSK